jgi:uncharacterized Fe-S cluster protein YjdI
MPLNGGIFVLRFHAGLPYLIKRLFCKFRPQVLKPARFTPTANSLMETIKEYTNGEVTIVWKPELCIHSGNCARGLSNVFKPREKPWINPEAATTDEIVAQVHKCPSGALSTYLNQEKDKDQA